ncbi:SRPBCC domain-containing protein [Actinoplanes aureus]|uniref:SRPBCC domain-containing protein n=1 Tax=Actinoplanes aureus TaxID=2792083 RepID=UPI002815FD36|nr:SRPBCC domain-containing protein [Actinoplanes aureus]
MTAELRGDELIARRHLPAAPARVWAAFTTPAGVAAFWGGSHATVPAGSVTVDLRPGGEFALDTRAPDGATRRLRFVYVSVTAPHELVFDEPVTGLRTTVIIRPAGEGADLAVHQRRLPPELRTEQAANGLASILDALAAYLRHDDTQRALVAEYFDGFRTSDHRRILATLTEDVEWVIHGHRTTRGKAEFDDEIENPAFSGSPELEVQRVYVDGPVVVTTGEGGGVSVEQGPFRFAFSDLFTFRDGLIARVDSYLVPLT